MVKSINFILPPPTKKGRRALRALFSANDLTSYVQGFFLLQTNATNPSTRTKGEGPWSAWSCVLTPPVIHTSIVIAQALVQMHQQRTRPTHALRASLPLLQGCIHGIQLPLQVFTALLDYFHRLEHLEEGRVIPTERWKGRSGFHGEAGRC